MQLGSLRLLQARNLLSLISLNSFLYSCFALDCHCEHWMRSWTFHIHLCACDMSILLSSNQEVNALCWTGHRLSGKVFNCDSINVFTNLNRFFWRIIKLPKWDQRKSEFYQIIYCFVIDFQITAVNKTLLIDFFSDEGKHIIENPWFQSARYRVLWVNFQSVSLHRIGFPCSCLPICKNAAIIS